MSFLGIFHYSNISQRRIVYYNITLSSLLGGYFLAGIACMANGYLIYYPAGAAVTIIVAGGFFLGTLAGTYIYRKFQHYRIVYIVSDILHVLLPAVYLASGLIPVSGNPVSRVMIDYPLVLPVLLVLWSLCTGIKACYILKISSGDYIDEKQGIFRLIVFSLTGLSLGFLLSYAKLLHEINPYAAGLFLLILPSVFLTNLPYNPSPFYTEDYDAERHSREMSEKRDNLVFTYLNFSFITLYLFFGFLSVEKFYGPFCHVSFTFITVAAAAMIAGMIIGRMIRLKNWYIYSESLFPFFFFLFLVLLYNVNYQPVYWIGILLFAPSAAVYGFSLYNTIKNIIENYDHDQRFRIIVFSMIILPVPILICLILIPFTNFWYFLLLYALAAANILLPAVYLINRNIKTCKKIIYFVLSLVFIPMLILIHLYFQVPLDNSVYAGRIKNFEVLQNVNYNANFIKAKATVFLNRYPVFNINDSIIRNMKRSLVPLSLYLDESEYDNIIFLDGNQKFFRNPIIGFYRDSQCIDTVSRSAVDYHRLPFSGTQTYVPDERALYFFLTSMNSRKKYRAVVDIPNIFDQNNSYFHFSENYYRTLKKGLAEDGIFAQVFNVPGSRREILYSAVNHIRSLFKNHTIYLFSNVLVIMASDSKDAFIITEEAYDRLSGLIRESEDFSGLFYNELHVLSHIIEGKLTDRKKWKTSLQDFKKYLPAYLLLESKNYRFPNSTLDEYFSNNTTFLSDINEQNNGLLFQFSVKNSLAQSDAILTLLKKTEMAEAREEFEAEMSYLYELKTRGEYNVYLREYLSGILSYKEDYYYTTALRLESERKWEEAKKLYHAILAMNNNNFDANYRLGLLYITLQDIEKSFNYLQQAMRLKPNNPKVLYQMGVHLFSTGNMNEAVTYFKQALAQDEKSAAIYKYLGMCYDNLGNYYEAERNFSKALIEDPNDLDTRSRLKSVQEKKEKETSQWDTPERKNEFEVEQDAEMPLPVSKSAYEVRLKDDDETLPLIDPITGEVVSTDKEESE